MASISLGHDMEEFSHPVTFLQPDIILRAPGDFLLSSLFCNKTLINDLLLLMVLVIHQPHALASIYRLIYLTIVVVVVVVA